MYNGFNFFTARKLVQDVLFLFQSNTTEQSWTNFHALMSQNPRENTFQTWLCFRLFKRVLSHVPPSQNSKSICTSFGAADMEIVAYFGGSIIQKIRKYAIRLTDKNKKKQIFLSCIERMIGSNTTKLVSVKTRGGLLNATDGMLRIFAIMEKQFRTMFGEGVECVVEMSENSFVTSVMSKEMVIEFTQLMGSTCVDDTGKSMVLKKSTSLFSKLELTIKLGNCYKGNVTMTKLN